MTLDLAALAAAVDARLVVYETAQASGMSLTTALALAIGALITLFDGMSRYNTRDRLGSGGPAGDADPVDIPPRYFTSDRGYIASVLLYLAAMETIYLLPAIVVPMALETPTGVAAVEDFLPQAFAAELLTFWGRSATFPIIWALLLVGALRYLPWLNHLEPRIRRMCHNVAEIPHFVHEVARRLYTAEIDVDAAFPGGVGGDLLFVSREHFNAAPSSEQRGWARLSYVMRELEELHTELGNLPAVHFGARFAEEYENAAAEFRSLAHRMARFFDEAEHKGGGGRMAELGADHRLKADLKRLLGRVELLFVILLNLRCRDEQQIVARLQSLGFKFDSNRLHSEAGPDAAVSVLALAAILFVISPALAAGVDIAMKALLPASGEGGWLVYPSNIIRADAGLFARVMVMWLMTFVTLLVLAFVNLSFARRFGGIDPLEMFAGDWVRRPYGKYMRAALLTAGLSYGAALALIYGMELAGLSDAMPIDFNPLLMTMWLPALFVISVIIHLFAHTRGRSFAQVLGEGLVSGCVWGAIVFATGFFFFRAMLEGDAPNIPPEEVPGAAIYYGFYAFFLGAAFMAALLYISKSARHAAEQASTSSRRGEDADLAPHPAAANVTALRR